MSQGETRYCLHKSREKQMLIEQIDRGRKRWKARCQHKQNMAIHCYPQWISYAHKCASNTNYGNRAPSGTNLCGGSGRRADSYSFSARTDKAVASPCWTIQFLKDNTKRGIGACSKYSFKGDNTFLLIKPAKSWQPGSAGSVLLASLHRNNFPMLAESKRKIKTSSLEWWNCGAVLPLRCSCGVELALFLLNQNQMQMKRSPECVDSSEPNLFDLSITQSDGGFQVKWLVL